MLAVQYKIVNYDIKYALDYHEATKHSEISIKLSRHSLDWNNKPRPFKIYTKLPSIFLPSDFSEPHIDAITCIKTVKTINSMTADATNTTNPQLDIRKLAEILFFSAGITREMKYMYGSYYMRAAPATGALYPIELYIVCQDIPGLNAGVYHFCPGDFTLTELRSGDYKAELATAAGDSKNIMTSPITIVFTSIAWRNAWKYEARSYRHWFWDSGVIAANLTATAASSHLQPFLILGFVDDTVNHLLYLDDKKEATIAMAAIGVDLAKHSAVSQQRKEINSLPLPEILPLSKKGEVDYPEIWKMHRASYLSDSEEVKHWINCGTELKKEESVQSEILDSRPLYPAEPSSQSSLGHSLGEVILLRGSSRKFAKSPISFRQLSTILESSTREVPLDFLVENQGKTAGTTATTIDIYMIVNEVEGLQRGGYFFNRSTSSIEQLKSKVPRDMSGYLCLGQPLFSDASVVFFLMTDLPAVLRTCGNRGYRASQFEAGILAGKIYLSAYAQQLGASGSTFFDDAVTEFFSPHAKDKSTMIAVGAGVTGYKARPGKVLTARLSKDQLSAGEYF
ncbi:MAG: SagB/ThcOx family dehydrogenase [Nitrososphaeraceae archaeon]|jgi:SagB-type dehydrogenase family enzyme